jgi:hypothetical protein
MKLATKLLSMYEIKSLPKKLPSRSDIKKALDNTKDVDGMFDRIEAVKKENSLVGALMDFWTIDTLQLIADGKPAKITTDNYTPKGKVNLIISDGTGSHIVLEAPEKEVRDAAKKLGIKIK